MPLANLVLHRLADAADIDLLTESQAEDDTDRVMLEITIEWEPWTTNRTPEEQTTWFERWCKALNDAVNAGTLSREVAVKLYPEEWFGEEKDRYPALEDAEALEPGLDEDLEDEGAGSRAG